MKQSDDARFETLDAIIRGRRSIRKYKRDTVPLQVLERVVESALWAPSGWGKQECSFVVVQGPVRERLQRIFCQALPEVRPILEQIYPTQPDYVESLMDFFSTYGEAPVLVLAYAGQLPDGTDDFLTTAVALQNLFLVAHESGLGSTWTDVMRLREDEINKVVDIHGQRLVCIAPLGYPDETPIPTARREGRVRWIGF